jgi:hypothetical protein
MLDVRICASELVLRLRRSGMFNLLHLFDLRGKLCADLRHLLDMRDAGHRQRSCNAAGV